MKITFDTTMGDILTAFPAAKVGLFHRYHIGGCSACGYKPTETLAEVCTRNGIQDGIDSITETLIASAAVEARLHISVAEALAEIANGHDLQLIDVRSPTEYDAEHIQSASLLSVDLTFEILDAWAADAPIVTYSNDGRRSLDKASYLTAYGKKNVRSLDRGLNAWKNHVGGLHIPGRQTNPSASAIVELLPPIART